MTNLVLLISSLMDDFRNQLYFGDNLEVLRDKIADESVDLIYLDPPFNSKANYNVLYKEVDGTPSAAQFHAFTDFWEWDEAAARTYHELVTGGNAPVALVELLQGFERFLGHNAMLAYLVMMAPRLVELKRVLKSTGSIYLHCDPTAGHYLKILMDAVFGYKNFRNELIWCYTQGGKPRDRFANKHDLIFWYSRSNKWQFNAKDIKVEKEIFSEKTSSVFHRVDEEGRRYYIKRAGGKEYIYYEDEGKIPNDWWIDIYKITGKVQEHLGYPTQKPEALLSRIIKASSNDGDVVLDPFCGCGTTIAAAQALGRKWIGIDITYLAINLIESRLADHFGDEVAYEVHGIPDDWRSACALAEQTDTPRKEFELWALSLVKARPKGDPTRKGGGDKGIDGVKFFIDGKERKPHKVIIQVKSDKKPKPSYVRDLRGVMEREQAAMGALILLHEPSSRSEIPAEAASAGFYHSEVMGKDYPKVQILTIKGLLDGIERLQIPQWAPDDVTFKRAERINKDKDKQGKLGV